MLSKGGSFVRACVHHQTAHIESQPQGHHCDFCCWLEEPAASLVEVCDGCRSCTVDYTLLDVLLRCSDRVDGTRFWHVL